MIRRAALALTLGLSACSVSAGLPHASFTTSRGAATPSTASTSGPASTSSSSSASENTNAGALALVVPDVTGKTADEAQAIVKAAGFVRDVERRSLGCEGAHTSGRISCQNPAAGTRVGRNDWVQIDVYTVHETKSYFLDPAQVRPLVGRPLPEVKRRLRELGHTGHLSIRENTAPTATCHGDLVCAIDQAAGRFDDDISISLAIPPGAE